MSSLGISAFRQEAMRAGIVEDVCQGSCCGGTLVAAQQGVIEGESQLQHPVVHSEDKDGAAVGSQCNAADPRCAMPTVPE